MGVFLPAFLIAGVLAVARAEVVAGAKVSIFCGCGDRVRDLVYAAERDLLLAAASLGLILATASSRAFGLAGTFGFARAFRPS